MKHKVAEIMFKEYSKVIKCNYRLYLVVNTSCWGLDFTADFDDIRVYHMALSLNTTKTFPDRPSLEEAIKL